MESTFGVLSQDGKFAVTFRCIICMPGTDEPIDIEDYLHRLDIESLRDELADYVQQ